MRIAIVGSGISGLTTAYLLHGDHEITVYERNGYAGGHANTVDVQVQGARYPVDTGFIVFNRRTYPNFVKLLERLGVAWKTSTMSFSVACERTGLEYSPSSLGSLFAQPRNLLRRPFLRMVREIFRFRSEYRRAMEGPEDQTLGELLERCGYSAFFRDYFILPMGSAIWSADPECFGDIPARFFVRFFENHGFLNVHDQPQWLTIDGGSRRYVKALTEGFRDRIHLNRPVKYVQRHGDHVTIQTADGSRQEYDHVVLAAHSDDALALLSEPTDRERDILGALPYRKNLAVLHTDESVLPRIRRVWASWNYRIPETPGSGLVMTYNMNVLQSIRAACTFCVTLNSRAAVDPERILYEVEYAHPVFTCASVRAQAAHGQVSGADRIHFCGAYWGNGFHEDGVNSALAVCRRFGKGL